jgi:hypothetical protein
MKFNRASLLLLCAAALLISCGVVGSKGITISEAWVRASPMVERAGAAYMTINNGAATDDRLLSVTSDAADMIELHQTQENNGVMEMSPVESIPIPANGQTELKPSSWHMMLMGLKRELKAGEKVTLTLKFEKAGEVVISAEVRDQ